MDKRIAEWLASDDTGISSTAIMLWLSAGTKDTSWGPRTPSDPADLGRCLRLLERIPEWKPRLPEMANAGPEWAAIVPHWSEIEASFVAECGGTLPGPNDRWECPKTYELMCSVRYRHPGEIRLGSGMTMRFGGAA
jgi:hypothetical protein